MRQETEHPSDDEPRDGLDDVDARVPSQAQPRVDRFSGGVEVKTLEELRRRRSHQRTIARAPPGR